MAELKRVGTQQEVLRKAVAEAIAGAHENGESFSVGPLKNFVEPGKPAKTAASEAEAPGIQAGWVGGTSTSEQASTDAAMPKADIAAMRKKKDAEAEARAESLLEGFSREQLSTLRPATDAEPVEHQRPYTNPNQSAAAIAELTDDPGVKERRGDLSKMQVALGGHDDTGAAAFNPNAYTFGQLPSSGDDRSKQQKKEDAKKLAVHRKEDERLKAKERKWREEQRRLAQKRAEEEAEEVRMKLLKAQLGPTPTTAGSRKVQQSSGQEKQKADTEGEKKKADTEGKKKKADTEGEKKSKWWKIW